MPSQEFENMVLMFKQQRAAAPDRPTTLDEFRTGIELLGQMMPPVSDVTSTELDVAGMPAVRFDPASGPTDAVILYLHGGGYVIGSRVSHAPVASNFAKAASTSVVLPEYRLAPEHPFPAAVDDAVQAFRWLLDQGIQPGKIVVAGESAGGGLTMALLVSLRDAGGPMPAGAVAISPWCDLTGLGDVSQEALDVDFLTPDAIGQFTEWYALPESRTSPLCSPVLADLSGLPPLLIQVGEREILLDMGQRLAANAKDAGVDVTLEVEPGMFHAWPLFAGALPEANESVARAGAFVRAALT